MSSKKITKTEFLNLIEILLSAIKQDDSFEGSLEYEVNGTEHFSVSAAIRIGNSEGQGGMILVQNEN